MKRTLLAALLAVFVGSAFAGTPTNTDKNGNWTPYDRDSSAASQAG